MLQNIEVQFEPIATWPGKPTAFRRRSPFKSAWTKTCQLLERELLKLDVKRLVVQLDCDRSQIRVDGMPRSDARTRGPGVILSFTSKHGPISYPCDTYPDWQENVRAIALALEALRAVDRYGVSRRGEQYKGWQALPAPSGDHWTEREAIEFLRGILGGDATILGTAASVEDTLRRAERKTHPDLGGRADDFKKVQRCRRLLVG